jgi:hypothetical protein
MRTFCNLMEAQLQDYRNEKYNRWKEVLRGYKAADKKLDWGDFDVEDSIDEGVIKSENEDEE